MMKPVAIPTFEVAVTLFVISAVTNPKNEMNKIEFEAHRKFLTYTQKSSSFFIEVA